MDMIIPGLSLFGILAVFYIIEVLLGSCTGVYEPEIGYVSSCKEITKLSHREFFTEFLPLLLIFIGIPLWMCFW